MKKSVSIGPLPGYVPTIIDVGGLAEARVRGGRCERNEFALYEQHGLTGRSGDTVRTSNIAVIVDAASCGENCSGKINGREFELLSIRRSNKSD